MARSTQEIYNAIIQEKETFSSLDGLAPSGDNATNLLAELNSNSRVAIWRLWAWVIAYATHVVEVLWDEQRKDLKALASQAIFGTPEWWVGAALRYQDGDTLIINNDNEPTYSTIDESKQIIEFASIQQVGQVGVIKVAKADGNGLPVPLSADELQRFSGYVNDIQPAGTALSAESRSSDKLIVDATIYYDANRVESEIQTAVEAAISDYLTSLPFNGAVFQNAFIDAIQAVDGVNDIIISQIQGQEAGQSRTAFSRQYSTVAGHIQFDSGTSNLSYVAE